MKCFAVITTEDQQWSEIPDYGRVRKNNPLVIDDFRMIRIEAKRKERFCDISVPSGMELTFHILGDDEELELRKG
jgi:hypothetical protein